MPPHVPSWTVRAAVALVVLTTAAGCTPVSSAGSAGSTSSAGATATATAAAGSGSTGDAPATGSAAAQLAKLTIDKPGSMKGYSREKFPHWRSTGANCDVRDSVLKRDGTKVKLSGCNVVAGTWKSRYDGLVITSPTKIDIDHMVPLADAWRSGAAEWTTEKRGDFANDLKDPQLVAVSASSNRAKGDQDPSTWKPKETGAWCVYAKDWIAVKTVWKLTVTTNEKTALKDMLEKCR